LKNKLILFFGILFLSSCIPFKSLIYGLPDKKDIQRFPSSVVKASGNCFEFAPSHSDIGQLIKVNEWGTGSPYFMDLDKLCHLHTVRSMLVIRNDTLRYQFYNDKLPKDALNASYSVAKSFTSALIGIAISEGYIKSEKQQVIDFIPELAHIPGAKKLKIENLLNMTSGFKNKLRSDAQVYYGNNSKKVFKQIEFEHEPGTYQEYINTDIYLLGIILHRATGMTPAEYLSEKIWKPLGMCSDAIWTRDKKGENLTFCCLGATSLDYAKFGRLYLNKGVWNGKQIIPKDWYEKSIRRDTTAGSSFNYNYCWHIGEKEYGDYLADGMYKQQIYICPKKKIVIVLFMDKENFLKAERTRWRNVFRQIVDEL